MKKVKNRCLRQYEVLEKKNYTLKIYESTMVQKFKANTQNKVNYYIKMQFFFCRKIV